MRIDHTEALQRGKLFWARNGRARWLVFEQPASERIAALIEEIVRETAEECAQIARRGETSGQQLTGIGVESDIRAAFHIPRSVSTAALTRQDPATRSKEKED